MVAKSMKQLFEKSELAEPIESTALAGDASARRYERIRAADGNTYIVMILPAGAQSLAEEYDNERTETKNREDSFINIQRFLEKNGIRAPKLYGFDGNLRILEDLGDRLLYDEMTKMGVDSPVERDSIVTIYKSVLDLLCQLHTLKPDHSNSCIAYQREYNRELFRWEYEHFVEYAYAYPLERPIADINNLWSNHFDSMSETLAQLPRTVTHRDYHSKNLLITDHGIALIDFQDALMGPHSYDLASLLYDSYIDLGEDIIYELVSYYYDRMSKGAQLGTRTEFERQVRLVGLQRNMKAAGRFFYIFAEKGKATHLSYIQLTMQHIRRHIEALGLGKQLLNLIPIDAIVDKANELCKKSK